MKIDVDKLALYAEFGRRCARKWRREKRDPSPNFYDGMIAGIDLVMEYVFDNFSDEVLKPCSPSYIFNKEDYKEDYKND